MVTPNKGMTQPANGADVGSWDIPVNANASIADTSLGGLTTLNATGLIGGVPLTLAQYTPPNIVVTGAPAGAINYQLPAGVGGFYFIDNNTTGGFAISFSSGSGGPAVTVGSQNAIVVIDPVNGARLADPLVTPAGTSGVLQYNNAGAFGGAAGLNYNPANFGLSIDGPLVVGGYFQVSGNVTSRLVLQGASATTLTRPVAFAASGMVVDCFFSNVFSTTLTGNVTGAPVVQDISDGQTINWQLTQDGVGNRTMIWPSNFIWPGGIRGVLSTTAGATDLLVATYFANTNRWLATLIKAFA